MARAANEATEPTRAPELSSPSVLSSWLESESESVPDVLEGEDESVVREPLPLASLFSESEEDDAPDPMAVQLNT